MLKYVKSRFISGNKTIALLFISCLFITNIYAQTFTETFENGWGQGMDRTGPAFADIDNDGLLDLVVGDDDGTLKLYEQESVNSDNFTFIEYNFSGIDVDERARPTFVEIDNDGLLDLVIGAGDGKLYHYEQESVNSYNFVYIPGGINGIDVGSQSAPTFTDIDNDGLLDLVIGEYSYNWELYEQSSPNSNVFTLITENFNGFSYGVPTFQYLDNDGLLDLIIGGDSGISHHEQEYQNSYDFVFIGYLNILFFPFHSYLAQVIIDIDNDDLLDLVFGETDGDLNHYEQASTNSCNFNVMPDLINPNRFDVGRNAKPTIIDIDNDGLLDMIVGKYEELGDNTFDHYEQESPNSDSFVLITENFNNINGYTSTFKDIDNDGLLDLIIGDGGAGGQMSHYEQESPGSYNFLFVSWNFSGIDITISIAPTFIDLDNDGLLDLIFGESYGRLYHYEQDSINSYNFVQITSNFNGIDTGYGSIPNFGDIDNDGLLDLMVGGSNGLFHYEQESAGSYNFVFITQNFNGINVKGPAPALVDINNDSLLDLMVGVCNGGIHLFMQESYLFPDFIAEHTQGTVPLTVQFTDLSTPQDSVVTWKWYFGDIDSSSVQNPTHIYQEDGSYTVSLTITDLDGFSITEVKQDYIQAFSVEIHNLDIGGNEDLQHLITHTPLITFEFYNAGGLTQTHYQIQVSTDSLFSFIDMWDTGEVVSSASSVLYAGNPLVDGITYYLRARVASGEAWSDWATLQFRMNSLPSIPVLLSPINNEIVFESNPILWIMNSTDAELDTLIYYFELATEESFNNIFFIQSGVLEGVDSTSCQVTIALTDNFQYWWRARTNDGYQFCNYSNPESFVLNAENEPPGEFELLTPENGTEVTTLLPILDWEDAIDPDPLDEVSYTILIGDEIPNLFSIDAGTESVYQLTTPLEDNTLYYWKVVATDLYGASTENTGGFHTFIVNTENNDPNSFDLITPTEYSVEIDLTPIFYWENAGDPDIGDTLTFYLYYDMDSLFIATVSVETDSNHYIPTEPLDDNSTYFWKVIAVDEAGFRASIESETWLFWTNTELEPPNPFDLLSPENGEEGLPTTPEFVWATAFDNDPNDYAVYNLLISEDSTFVQVDYSAEGLVDTFFVMSDELTDSTRYFWRIDAVDTDSLITSSGVWSFIAGYLSSEPEEVFPMKNYLSQNYPNPFNLSTTISFYLRENSNIELEIFNIKGQRVKTLKKNSVQSGNHSIIWNGDDNSGKVVSSGIYFYQLIIDSKTEAIRKCLLMK